MSEKTHAAASGVSLVLAVFFWWAGATVWGAFLVMALATFILAVIFFMRVFTSSNRCSACKSNVPNGATICKHCGTHLAVAQA